MLCPLQRVVTDRGDRSGRLLLAPRRADVGTRRKAKTDTKIEQGKRRDAFFSQLRQQAQPKATTPTAAPAAQEAGAAPKS
jgi:hypothetical protein